MSYITLLNTEVLAYTRISSPKKGEDPTIGFRLIVISKLVLLLTSFIFKVRDMVYKKPFFVFYSFLRSSTHCILLCYLACVLERLKLLFKIGILVSL